MYMFPKEISLAPAFPVSLQLIFFPKANTLYDGGILITDDHPLRSQRVHELDFQFVPSERGDVERGNSAFRLRPEQVDSFVEQMTAALLTAIPGNVMVNAIVFNRHVEQKYGIPMPRPNPVCRQLGKAECIYGGLEAFISILQHQEQLESGRKLNQSGLYGIAYNPMADSRLFQPQHYGSPSFPSPQPYGGMVFGMSQPMNTPQDMNALIHTLLQQNTRLHELMHAQQVQLSVLSNHLADIQRKLDRKA